MPPDTPAPTANSHAQGVIHDIGYRHYDGQRGDRGYIRRSLFTDSLRGAYGLGRSGRSKIMPMLLLGVMCLPAGAIVAGTALVGADRLVAGYPSYLFNLQLVISIFVAAQSPVAVSRDLRFGVMSLYFSRPLQRHDYVLGKYAAMASALFLLTAAPLLIMFFGALIVGLPLREQIPDFLRALTGAGLLSLMLAGLGLVIAAITPRRGLAVAAVISVLAVLIAVQAIAQEITAEEGATTVSAYLSLLSPFAIVEGVQSSLLNAASVLPTPPGALGTAVFALAVVLIVGLSYLILLLRYRSVSVS